MNADRISDLLDTDNSRYHDRSSVRLVTIVSRNRSQITKNNRMMAFAEVEDRSGTCEVIVFPNVLDECRDALFSGAVTEIEGTLSFKEDEEAKVLAEKITLLPPAKELMLPDRTQKKRPEKSVHNERMTSKAQTLYLKIPSLECTAYLKAKNLLEIFPGTTRVIFYLSEARQQMLAPRSLWTAPNPTLLDELRYRLGEENVRLK